MKTSEVATTLRMIAYALDKAPELNVSPCLSIYPAYFGDDAEEKRIFLALASVWPHPFKKSIGNEGTSYEDYRLEFDGWAKVMIDRKKVCTLVVPAKPAVYSCPSTLSDEETEKLGGE